MQEESMFDEVMSDCRYKAVMKQYFRDGRIRNGLFWSHLNENLTLNYEKSFKGVHEEIKDE